MSKWRSHPVLGLAVLLAVACSNNSGDTDAVPAEPETQGQVSTQVAHEVVFDLPAIIGTSRSEVDGLLGEPDSTGTTVLCEVVNPKAFYNGGQIEVVFIDGKAEWVTVWDLPHTFEESVLEALGLSPVDASFTNVGVMRWENLPRIQELSVFGNQSGKVRYALAIHSTKDCG